MNSTKVEGVMEERICFEKKLREILNRRKKAKKDVWDCGEFLRELCGQDFSLPREKGIFLEWIGLSLKEAMEEGRLRVCLGDFVLVAERLFGIFVEDKEGFIREKGQREKSEEKNLLEEFEERLVREGYYFAKADIKRTLRFFYERPTGEDIEGVMRIGKFIKEDIEKSVAFENEENEEQEFIVKGYELWEKLEKAKSFEERRMDFVLMMKRRGFAGIGYEEAERYLDMTSPRNFHRGNEIKNFLKREGKCFFKTLEIEDLERLDKFCLSFMVNSIYSE